MPDISPTPAACASASMIWSSRLVPLRGMPAMNTGTSLAERLDGKFTIVSRVQWVMSAPMASV
jgi:hypothetical protein